MYAREAFETAVANLRIVSSDMADDAAYYSSLYSHVRLARDNVPGHNTEEPDDGAGHDDSNGPATDDDDGSGSSNHDDEASENDGSTSGRHLVAQAECDFVGGYLMPKDSPVVDAGEKLVREKRALQLRIRAIDLETNEKKRALYIGISQIDQELNQLASMPHDVDGTGRVKLAREPNDIPGGREEIASPEADGIAGGGGVKRDGSPLSSERAKAANTSQTG